MRRTLFLVSAVAAATASSFAATSSNIVGYVKLSLGQGFSMISNQLDNGAGNKATAVLAGVPNNTSVYKFVGGNFLLIQLVGGTWEGDDVDMTLAPGEGVFIDLPAQTTVTFVGEVQTGTQNVPLLSGFNIVSSKVPQVLALDQSPTGANFPATNGDGVYRYKPATSSYELDEFLGGAWEGDSNGAAPSVTVGEAFWVNNKGSTKSWSRTFNVN